MRPLLLGTVAVLLTASLVRAAPPDDVRVDVLFRSEGFGSPASPVQFIQASDGLFYGTALGNWPYAGGVVFSMTPSGAVTVVHRFDSGGSEQPSLVEGTDGNFYGPTFWGGRFNQGTVFRMTPAGEVTTLHEFSGPDGVHPLALIRARNGVFYGTTSATIYQPASVFWITADGAFGTLANIPGDGAHRLFQATDGSFFVTTLPSFLFPSAQLFRIGPDGTTTLVRSADSTTLVQAADGNIYGADLGSFFRLTPDGTSIGLSLFNAGERPSALEQAIDGNFYVAVTLADHGALYRITPAGAASVVYTFTQADGFYALPVLVRAFDGSLYGTGIAPDPGEGWEGIIYRLSGLTSAPSVPPSVKGDLDGNGTADFVLRQLQTGDLWLLTSTADTAHLAPANYVPGVPLSWQIAAIADVDGDGKADLIWHDALTGDVSVWLMDGGQPRRAQLVVFGVPLAWHIIGSADLDGDHKADLIWRHAETGDVAVWFMDGVVIRRGPIVAQRVPLAWQIVDVADVDGDGKADVIWRHGGTGDVAVWLMDGETVKQSAVVASGVPLTWQVAGVGDVDGDGKADLVWRHVQNGDVAIWLLEGAMVRASPVIAVGVPLTFQVAKVADVDGDGRADLIWRHTEPVYGSGPPTIDVSAWLMNGVSVTQGVFMLSSLPEAWQLQ
jgi:uncharacterized repeat protein (TIGR03803 family)